MNKSDDETIKICKKLGVNFYRGSLKNVAKRYYDILINHESDYFIRISADSPLIDTKLIDFIAHKKNIRYDIVTNVLKRSYPKGQSVELLKTKFFLENYKYIKSKNDLENVTSYFYRNSNRFKILNIENKIDFSFINLSVDTIEDLKKIRKIYKNTKIKNWLSYTKDYLKYL